MVIFKDSGLYNRSAVVVFPPSDDADCKLVVPTILGHSVFHFYSARIKVHCHRLATSNAKIRLAKRDTVSECCSAHFCSLGSIPFFQSIVAMGWAIALHGGAGDISKDLPTARREAVEACLSHCLRLGVSALQSSHTALDVAELVVKELEANPVFNAGRGSVLTTDGTVEMEACIMDGPTMNCGAVSGLSTVVHPISLARLVMEKTPHIYLAFEGAEAFARQQGLETKEPSYFITKENQERLARAQENNLVQLDYTKYSTTTLAAHNPVNAEEEQSLAATDPQKPEFETVGCVAVDMHGSCAAATSTGGLVNKMVGRIGDTPVVGAGNYANHLCAVSATGRGEAIIKATVAREVAAIMEYRQVALAEAVEEVIGQRLPTGKGGLVAVSATGDVVMGFNTMGMYRASVKEGGFEEIGIWH